MPLFNYKAKNNKGKIVEETIQAVNRQDVAALLKADGLQILTVKILKEKEGIFKGKISLADKSTFCRFLATMLRAGLSLPEAVEIIKQESENKRLKKILSDIAFHTRKGKKPSSVLSKYPAVFDPVFLTIVKAGEETGTMDESFDYLAKQMAASYELSQKVKSSLMYPAVILSAMLGVGVLMMVFVLPKISGVFLKMNIELPAITRALLLFGKFAGENTFLVLGLLLAVFILIFLLGFIESTRKIILQFLAKFPAIKKMMDKIDIARFARVLSVLLRSGVSITEALDVAAESLHQPKMREEAGQFSKSVMRGESLSEILTKGRQIFPLIVVQTIKTGEKTGSLESVLQDLAEFYEQEVDHQLKSLTALLEPVLMLIIGIAVGAMVIMVVAPIYSIVGGLQDTLQ